MKEASQAMYLALKLKYIKQYPDVIPPYTLDELINQTNLTDSETAMIERMVAARKKDKTAEFVIDEVYKKFIQQSI